LIPFESSDSYCQESGFEVFADRAEPPKQVPQSRRAMAGSNNLPMPAGLGIEVKRVNVREDFA